MIALLTSRTRPRLRRPDPGWYLLAALWRLRHQLNREVSRSLARLRQRIEDSQKIEESLAVIAQLHEIRSPVSQFLQENSLATTQVSHQLRHSISAVRDHLDRLPDNQFEERHALERIFYVLIMARRRIDQIRHSQVTSKPRTIAIPSALLSQSFHSLFPAEKMLVGSASTKGDVSTINALYNVTGNGSRTHVTADRDKLSRALIAMEATESFFLAWVHSHPGRGPTATWPSSIDLMQHQDWLRHYSSHLLSAIMVADGHIRFWGEALESGQTKLEIVGPGVKRKEDSSVYKIVQ